MGVVLAVPSPIAKPPIVSAAELLSRSDAALAQLVQPGEVLYRCWRVTLTSWDQPAAEPKTQQHVVHEWMDGADFERVAGRTSTTDGRLLMAYVSAREGENIRARVYFSPGFSDEPLGALNIEPTRAEFLTAVERFPANDRPLLQTYLDRYYIYMPIAGERRFNRAMLEGSRQPSLMPRVILSFDDAATLDGEPVYRIRVVDPARVRFRWRSEGPPVVQLARAETVRFIAKDSYLTLKAEQTNEFENGRRTFSIREMVENRAIRVADLARDPFQLDVPPGTPVQRQSAFELLTGVARVLKRIPAAATEP